MKYFLIIFLTIITSCGGNSQTHKNTNHAKGLSIQILIPAAYRGVMPTEFEYILSEDWCDFYKDEITGEYFLKKANVNIGETYDECIDGNVTYVNSDKKPLLLIQGINAKKESIYTLPLKKNRVWVGEEMDFEFKKMKYRLQGKGITVERNEAYMDGFEKPQRWDVVENYELYLLEEKTEKKQLLLSIPDFDGTFMEILWIGDLDEDGKPDFIFDTSPYYEYKQIELFLSSPANENEIVKDVATSGYDFSC